MDAYCELSKMIDHSLLQPCLTAAQLEEGIQLARAYDTASVCILPWYLKRCAELLAGSTVKASTVVGFPHGSHVTAVKVGEAQQALRDGAAELDVVVNISAVLSGKWDLVTGELKALVEVTHAAGQKIKVIFENCYLADEHKIRLCEICGQLGADWVKTSTGYGTSGAVDADLKLMRQHSPAQVQVKAAGGVRTYGRLLEVKALGVTRVGATATAAILGEARQRMGLAPIQATAAGPKGY
jgi:deoxyribose-phosphate aldolase